MKERVSFLRHAAWVSPESLKSKINIIGCGATGSSIAMLCARMGFTNFQLWDADTVEDHNLPNQAYYLKHINMPKVEALKELLLAFNPEIKVETHNEFFTTEKHKNLLDGILVLTVDTQSGRKDIYDSFYSNPSLDFVVETKVGWDYAEAYFLDPLDLTSIKNWYKTLIPDDQIPDGPCNLRICTTLVNLVSSYVVHIICHKMHCMKNDKEFTIKTRQIFDLTDAKLNTICL